MAKTNVRFQVSFDLNTQVDNVVLINRITPVKQYSSEHTDIDMHLRMIRYMYDIQ